MGEEPGQDKHESLFDEPYVVSDERLAEIRSMFTVNGISLVIRGNITSQDLAWAIDDLLTERDEHGDCEAVVSEKGS